MTSKYKTQCGKNKIYSVKVQNATRVALCRASNLRAREKRKRATVQADSQGHVSHYHELMSRVWPVNAYFLLRTNTLKKWGIHYATRFPRLSPFSDSYEIYSEQQLLNFQETMQKQKEQVGIVLSVTGMSVIATEKKIFMQQGTFLSCSLN